MAIASRQQEVMRLLTLGALDQEIMQTLNIKRSMYMRYKQRILEESKEAFNKQKAEDLAYHKDLLHNRLSHFLRRIEQKLAERDNRTGNSLLNPREYAMLALAGQNIAVNLFKLEVEGIRILQRNLNGHLKEIAEGHNIEYESYSDRYPRNDINDTGTESGNGEQRILRLLPSTDRGTGSGGDREETRSQDVSTNTETVTDQSQIY